MSQAATPPELVVCIVMDHHQVEEILTGFLEMGIRGATVVDSHGMGEILSTQVPIFAGFKALFPGSTAGTYLIMSVVDHEIVDDVILLVEEICGDLSLPGSGFLFTLPVLTLKSTTGSF
jgi:hypothetical protein